MGFAVFAYLLQAISGGWMFYARQERQHRPDWLRSLHYITGVVMLGLVLLLLGIGIVGTFGHYGSLGHSLHLPAGLAVVDLVFLSAWSAVQISPQRTWARWVHIGTNIVLCIAFILVSLTGWDVVQKYLP
jgi:thiol:disulfide interchange protein